MQMRKANHCIKRAIGLYQKHMICFWLYAVNKSRYEKKQTRFLCSGSISRACGPTHANLLNFSYRIANLAVSRVFVPLDQRSENESNHLRHISCVIDADCAVKSDGQNSVISFVILNWLLPEPSFSDRWSRVRTLWERNCRIANQQSQEKMRDREEGS